MKNEYKRMLKYLITIPLLSILLIYITIEIKTNNQARKILNNYSSANECNYVSTKNFSNGKLTDAEYHFYRCLLTPDFKTLYFYVDKDTGKIVNSRLLPTSYESIVGSSPRFCTTGISKIDNDNIYDVCSIFIVYEGLLTGRHELFFSTPLSINNNNVLRHKIMQQEYVQYVDDFL